MPRPAQPRRWSPVLRSMNLRKKVPDSFTALNRGSWLPPGAFSCRRTLFASIPAVFAYEMYRLIFLRLTGLSAHHCVVHHTVDTYLILSAQCRARINRAIAAGRRLRRSPPTAVWRQSGEFDLRYYPLRRSLRPVVITAGLPLLCQSESHRLSVITHEAIRCPRRSASNASAVLFIPLISLRGEGPGPVVVASDTQLAWTYWFTDSRGRPRCYSIEGMR